MEKEPMLYRFVLTVAVVAVAALSLWVALILMSTPMNSQELGPQDQGGTGARDNDTWIKPIVIQDNDTWTEPIVLPPPSYFGVSNSANFTREYSQSAPGGTCIYFQNLTAGNGTVYTSFDVDDRWFCVHVFIYVIGPMDDQSGSMYEECWIGSPTGECSSGSTGYFNGEGGSASTTWLYNEGPYGTWTFDYTITNGRAIIWIMGFEGEQTDFNM